MANFFKKIFSDLDEEPETSEYYEEPQPEPAPVPAPVVSRSNKVVPINNARVSQQNLSSKIELIEPRVYCLLYTSPSPRDATLSRMPSSA